MPETKGMRLHTGLVLLALVACDSELDQSLTDNPVIPDASEILDNLDASIIDGLDASIIDGLDASGILDASDIINNIDASIPADSSLSSLSTTFPADLVLASPTHGIDW